MRPVLDTWVNDADALQYVDHFRLERTPVGFAYLRGREDDYYLALVGELFARLIDPYEDDQEWARLGNAITQLAFQPEYGVQSTDGQLPRELALFAATAFYLGGFSASAYLTLKAGGVEELTDGHVAAFELLARPRELASTRVRAVVGAVRRGDLDGIDRERQRAEELAAEALDAGPEEWVGWRLFCESLRRSTSTNVRAVLPREAEGFWDLLVSSLLGREPPVWDFFPSQVEAIRSGLLESEETFSLQMPTGSGKTALTEALLYRHLRLNPDGVAVIVVPYRSLASELRGTLVRRLNRMGLKVGVCMEVPCRRRTRFTILTRSAP